MIRSLTVATNRKLPGLSKALQQYPDLAMHRIDAAFRKEWSPQFLAAISEYAPPRNKSVKFVWSHNPAANARARAYYFANFPRTGYKRTGALKRAWRVKTVLGRASIAVSVENNRKGAVFVVGDLKTGAGQIPGHKAGHWPLAKRTTDIYLSLARDVARTATRNLLAELKAKS